MAQEEKPAGCITALIETGLWILVVLVVLLLLAVAF